MCIDHLYTSLVLINWPMKKRQAKMITIWVPKELLPPLAEGVKKIDSDRSKFVRNAIREKLTRHGVTMEDVR